MVHINYKIFRKILHFILLRGGLHIAAVLTAFVTATVSTASERYTKDGMDTIACPMSSMTVMPVCILEVQ